eukprot:7350242-Prymnesium_polylepis.1
MRGRGRSGLERDTRVRATTRPRDNRARRRARSLLAEVLDYRRRRAPRHRRPRQRRLAHRAARRAVEARPLQP